MISSSWSTLIDAAHTTLGTVNPAELDPTGLANCAAAIESLANARVALAGRCWKSGEPITLERKIEGTEPPPFPPRS